MKKLTILAVLLVMLFSVTGLKSQTFPVPKWNIHVHGGYTLTLPDLKGDYPGDLTNGKNPTPYFIKNGFNFGADAKYYVDKKSTFGVMLALTYSLLSSGDLAVSDSTLGNGTLRTNMNIFTIGVGVEYDFAPKRPANPFVNAQFTTNIFGGKFTYDATSGNSNNGTLTSAVRFGAMFGAGVDVKLSKSMGIVIGGRYAFANLFGKDSTANTTTTYGLNDLENANTLQKSRKIAYLQFYAGASFYFGLAKKVVMKK